MTNQTPTGAETNPDAPTDAASSASLHETSDAIDPAMRVLKDQYRWKFVADASVKLNYILAAALLVSVVANGVLGWRAFHPDRQYFASDNGRIFPMIPLSQPYRKAADVIQTARDTVTRSFTMDFLNWRGQLEDVRGGYTREGFKSFLKSLDTTKVLDTIKGRRMNMSVTAGTGVLTKEGVEEGRYVWYIEMPIEVRLTGQTSELPSQKFLALVRMERIPTLDAIEGIGVGQLVTRPWRG